MVEMLQHPVIDLRTTILRKAEHLEPPSTLASSQKCKDLSCKHQTLPQSKLTNLRIFFKDLLKLVVSDTRTLKVQTLQPTKKSPSVLARVQSIPDRRAGRCSPEQAIHVRRSCVRMIESNGQMPQIVHASNRLGQLVLQVPQCDFEDAQGILIFAHSLEKEKVLIANDHVLCPAFRLRQNDLDAASVLAGFEQGYSTAEA